MNTLIQVRGFAFVPSTHVPRFMGTTRMSMSAVADERDTAEKRAMAAIEAESKEQQTKKKLTKIE